MTPLGALFKGSIAGAAGTVAMDLFLYGRYRAGGGDTDPLTWEFGGPSAWDQVPAPAQVGRRLYEGLRKRPLADRYARLTNNIMHWGYGIGWGGALGVIAASVPRRRAVDGPLFGSAVWLSSYVTLPLAGLYKPIWKYSLAELAPDLVAHLTYGTATERTFRALQ